MKIFLCVLCIFISLKAAEMSEQKRHFDSKGYVWIRGFYSEEQVALLKNWAKKIETSANTVLALSQSGGISMEEVFRSIQGCPIVVPEAKDPMQVCRAEDLLRCFPGLNHFIDGSLTSYLSTLLEKPYVAFKDKINFKWPGGGAFAPHQDYPAFAFLGPKEHITAMVCIDAADEENGCLYIAKKWQEDLKDVEGLDQKALREGNVILPYIHGGEKHGTIEPSYVEKLEWEPLKVSAGDVVFFTSYIPHYSEPNKSKLSRRALFITYNTLESGEYKTAYYHAKRSDPLNPRFHFGTPTKGRD